VLERGRRIDGRGAASATIGPGKCDRSDERDGHGERARIVRRQSEQQAPHRPAHDQDQRPSEDQTDEEQRRGLTAMDAGYRPIRV